MSWRTVIVSNNAKIDYQLGFLTIRGLETKKVHISEINILIIESTQVSLTAYLLSELTKNKVKVIFCDEKRNPSSELIPYYGSHDTSLKIKIQTQWTEEIKKLVWTEIVSEKIRKQSEYLKKENHINESNLLQDYVDNIELGDNTNREGHAAKVYFNSLFGMDFTRTGENAINSALDYGYSIILSCFTREIVSNGYITPLGLNHNNMFNQFNLACDLMEPFRILVDKKVKKEIKEVFGKDEKHKIINLLSEKVYVENKEEYVTNAIKIYTKSVLDALCENDISIIRFYRNEL